MNGAKILIVEDEGVVALNIQSRLSALGYIILDVVTTGEEAIAATAAKQPDLVLMDIKLPGEIDGIQAAAVIRERFNIPIVYITAYGDKETLQRAKVTEPYGYIIKPFSAIELGTAIEISIYKHSIDAERKSREQWLSTTLKSIGDGVITTDKEGAIDFLNPVAEKLTGWHQSEALGKPLSQVFRILDESTGEWAANPAEKALRTGKQVGLGNQIVLLAKDGRKIPIDDSAAPIKDEKENVMGAVLVFHDIIERKQAEWALQNSEERFRSIFDQAFNFMWLLQPDGTVLSANQTVLDLGKMQATEVVGCWFWKGQWWRLSTATGEELQGAVSQAATGETVRCQVQSLVEGSGDEKDIFIDLSIKPITAPTGKVVLLIAEGQDISDRFRAEAELQRMNAELERRVAERTAELQQTVKQLEAEIGERQRKESELRNSQYFIQRIADTTPNIIYIYDIIEQRNIYANREIARILGYTPEQIKAMGRAFLEKLMHPEDLAKVTAHLSKFDTATDGEIFSIEYRMRKASGDWRWLVSRDTIFTRTADGKPQQILGTADDITDRQLAQQQLEETTRLQQAILNSANYTIISTTPEGTILTFNAAAERLLGYTAAQVVGKATPEIIHDVDEVAQRAQELSEELGMTIAPGFEVFVAKARRGAIEERQWTYIRKDGSSFPVQLSVTAWRDGQGQIAGFLGIGSDISDRKQAEETLKLRERAIAASNNGMIICDGKGSDLEVIYVNPAFEQMTGYTAAEVIGRNCRFLQGCQIDQPALDELRAALRAGTGCNVTLRNYRKDGSMFWNNLSISPIYDDSSHITHYIGIQTDITALLEAQEELQATTSRLTALMENIEVGVLVKDESGKVVLTNQAFCDMFAIPGMARDLKGADFSEFAQNYQHLFAKETDFVKRYDEISQAKKVAMGEELQMVSGRTLEQDYAPIFVERNYSGNLWMYRDISERQQADAALRESEARWHKLIENSADGILVVNGEGIICFVNPAAEIIFGFLAEELLGTLFGIPLETTEINEIYIIQPDGSWLTVDMRVVTIKWSGELAYLASLRDISDRKQAEKDLQQAKDQLQAVLDAVPGLVSWISCSEEKDLSSLKYIGVNKHLATSLNMPAEAFIGQDIGFLKTRTQFENFIRKIFESRDERMSEEVTIVIDNREREYLIVAQKYNEGKAAVTVGLDISDRKQMKLELNMSKQWLQYLLSFNPAAIYSRQAGKKYGTNYISENVADILGYQAEEFMLDENFWSDRIHPSDREEILSNLSRDLEGGIHSQEYRFQHQDGSYRWLYDELKVVPDQQGKPRELIGYWADITDRKQAEELLKASLVEKETLLKEIHHRVKNNLQIISSLLRLQSRKIQDGTALKSLAESQNRVQVMALVHEQLYRSDNLADINFSEYIQTLVGNLFRSYDARGVTFSINIENIALAIDIAIPCGLLVNELVSNSLKYAFPEGRTGCICISMTASDENEYILKIGDNGVGIPADVDWTKTKSLGLQLVRKLTKQLEGEISLARSQGTEFRLTFGKLKQKQGSEKHGPDRDPGG